MVWVFWGIFVFCCKCLMKKWNFILDISNRIWRSPKPRPSLAQTKMDLDFTQSMLDVLAALTWFPGRHWKQSGFMERWVYITQSSVNKTNWRLFAKVETFWNYSSLTLPNCSPLILNSLGPLTSSPHSANGCSGPHFPRQDEPVSNTRSWLLTAICCTQGSLEVTAFSDWFQWASGHTFCNRLCYSPFWGWVPAVTNILMGTHNHTYDSVPGLLFH